MDDLSIEQFNSAVAAMAQVEKLHPRATLDALLLAALQDLGMEVKGFTTT